MPVDRLIRPTEWKPVDIPSMEEAALQAVCTTENTLVKAGPGAGKTELLGQKAAYLLQTGQCAYPRRILAISFKRDAAKNLRERIEKRCSRSQAARFISFTFDAFAKGLLDRFWRALPSPWEIKDYRIADYLKKPEFVELIRRTMDAIDNPGTAANRLYTSTGVHYSGRELIAVNQDKFNLAIQEFHLAPITPNTVAIFLLYTYFIENISRDIAPFTFPMIGRLAELIVQCNPKIRSALLATYSHVFVDEFQDTTGVQYDLLKVIFADSNVQVTAVGDGKQGIMKWAGARRSVFDDYQHDFLAECLSLTQNYRSNSHIVNILNILKTELSPDEPDFVAVKPALDLPAEEICALVESPDLTTEAETIAHFILHQVEDEIPPREIALLVRQKSADWEKRFRPHFEAVGVQLRNEDRDIFKRVRIQELMTEPVAETLASCLDLLSRRQGGVAWAKVLDFLYVMEGCEPDYEQEQAERISKELAMFRKSNKLFNQTNNPDEQSCKSIMIEIVKFFSSDRLKRLAPQYLHGDFFLNVVKATIKFMMECTKGATGWGQVLSRFRGDEQVPLLTITKSKGLEYHTVIIVGLDDKEWWSFKKDTEEGHSNFFVAASRAGERLFLLRSKKRTIAGIQEIYNLLDHAGIPTVSNDQWCSEIES